MKEVAAEDQPYSWPKSVGEVTARWRSQWEQSVALANGPDPRLALRRQDYGTFLFIGLDLLLIVIGVILFSIPLTVVAVMMAAQNHTIGPQDPTTLATNPVLLLASVLVTDLPIVLVLWYRSARLTLGWAIFGLGNQLRSNLGRVILLGVALGIASLVLSTLIEIPFQNMGLDTTAQNKMIIEPLKHAPLWLAIAVAGTGTFIAPVVEELLFRGYIFRALVVRKGVRLAYLLSAASFALVHALGTLGTSINLLPIVPALFVIGLLLCFAYHRTGNIACDITAHMFNNGISFAASLIVLHH